MRPKAIFDDTGGGAPPASPKETCWLNKLGLFTPSTSSSNPLSIRAGGILWRKKSYSLLIEHMFTVRANFFDIPKKYSHTI